MSRRLAEPADGEPAGNTDADVDVSSPASSMADAHLAEMLAALEVIQRLMQLGEGKHPIDNRAHLVP